MFVNVGTSTGTERRYTRIRLTPGVIPALVTVRNLGDKPGQTQQVTTVLIQSTKVRNRSDQFR